MSKDTNEAHQDLTKAHAHSSQNDSKVIEKPTSSIDLKKENDDILLVG